MIQLMLPIADDGCVKDTVVSLLYNSQKLSAKEIWYKIKRVRNVSYHGVYKAVSELLCSGVLEKRENRYSLSPGWLTNLRNFINKFERKREVMRATA